MHGRIDWPVVRNIVLTCCLGLFLVGGTYALTMESVDRLVRKDAENTAYAWSKYIAGHLKDIEQIAAGGPLSPESLKFIEQARSVGSVFRFKLFDGTGKLRLVSDELDKAETAQPELAKHNAKAAKVVITGAALTKVEEGKPPERPLFYAETYIPIVIDGRTVAIAEVYVDQTDKRILFRENFTYSALGFAPLLVLVFGVPAAGYYLRTQQKIKAEMKLNERNGHFNIALDNMSQGLCMFDREKRLVFCNDSYIEMYGYSRELAKPGTPFLKILEHRVAAEAFPGGKPEDYIRERLAAVEERRPYTNIQDLPDGRVIAIAHSPMADGGWVATHDDVTDIRRIEEMVAYMAHHDALTNLPNRVRLSERIETELKRAGRGRGFAVLSLDLDRFKTVNDTLGHSVGDELLKEVAKRLNNCVGGTDMVARLGGDEFAILQISAEQPEKATALAGRIANLLAEPIELNDHQVMAETSVGIAIAPNDGKTADELLKNADMALHRAKQDGRGIYRFFEEEMDRLMKQRRKLELDLRKALKSEEFELHFQPLIHLDSDSVSGFEALLRWNHTERGLVSPGEFIPIAEETGIIVPLGEWVITKACAEAAIWPTHVSVAVNLSPLQFKSRNLVATVINALAVSGIAPQRLQLEITESVLLEDSAPTLEMLHALRRLGVKIAMDDFGTGYSSLSYLRSFPFDKIKIDGSFIRDLSEREDAIAIVRAISSLGKSLGMVTTAEGVETEDQLASVRAEGCTEVQGYYFSPPRPAAEISRLYFQGGKKSADGA